MNTSWKEKISWFVWKSPTELLEIVVAIHFLLHGMLHSVPLFGAIQASLAVALIVGIFRTRRACNWYALIFVLLAVSAGVDAGHHYYVDNSVKATVYSTFWAVFSCIPAVRAIIRNERAKRYRER